MITVYQTAREYLNATELLLEKRELENNLILGLCNELTGKPGMSKNCVFINSYENGLIQATSIKTQDRAIVASMTADSMGISELAAYYRAQPVQLAGVFGENQPADEFARYYGKEYATEMAMIVHRLSRVNNLPESPGHFKMAEEQDTELITEWILRFKKEANPADRQDRLEALHHVHSLVSEGNLFLWIDQDNPVSMAALNRQTKHVGIVGYVYSPAPLRRKGYATAIVQKLSEHILQNGFKYCGLFTDRDNLTSNHIYTKIGYEPLIEYANIGFRI